MKRVIAILFVVILLLALPSCKSKSTTKPKWPAQTVEINSISFQIPEDGSYEFLADDELLASVAENTYLAVFAYVDTSDKTAWEITTEVIAQKKDQGINCRNAGKKSLNYGIYESWEEAPIFENHSWLGIYKHEDNLYGFTFNCPETKENEELFRDIMNSITTEKAEESTIPVLQNPKTCMVGPLVISIPEESLEVNREESRWKNKLELQWEGTTFIAENYPNSSIGDAAQHIETYIREDSKASYGFPERNKTAKGYDYYVYNGLEYNVCKGFIDTPSGVWKFELQSTLRDTQENLFCEILDSLVFEDAEAVAESEPQILWTEPEVTQATQVQSMAISNEYRKYSYPSIDSPIVSVCIPTELEENTNEDWCEFQLTKQELLFLTATLKSYDYDPEDNYARFYENKARDYIMNNNDFYNEQVTSEPYNSTQNSQAIYSAVEIYNTQSTVPYYEYIIYTGTSQDVWTFTMRVFLDGAGQPLCNWRKIADSICFY